MYLSWVNCSIDPTRQKKLKKTRRFISVQGLVATRKIDSSTVTHQNALTQGGGNCMQKKLWFTALATLLILSMTHQTVQAIPETQRVETPEGPVFYYTIQEGDTLWDLSRKFYNSQWVWPGLWEMNRQVKNPHLIYPGKKIQVFLAEPVRTPPDRSSLSLETVSPIAPAPSVEMYHASIENLGFIKENAIAPAGQLLTAESQNTLLSLGDVVFLDAPDTKQFIPGSRYHVFSTRKVSLKYDNTCFKGIKHTIKATLTIVETTNTHIKARITRAFMPASPGDLIMPVHETEKEFAVNTTPPPIQARIICSQEDNALLADRSIAFITAGSEQAVTPGNMYTIYKKQTTGAVKPVRKSATALPLLKNGTLMVLHTEKNNSTVKILYSDQEIVAGDIVQ